MRDCVARQRWLLVQIFITFTELQQGLGRLHPFNIIIAAIWYCKIGLCNWSSVKSSKTSSKNKEYGRIISGEIVGEFAEIFWPELLTCKNVLFVELERCAPDEINCFVCCDFSKAFRHNGFPKKLSADGIKNELPNYLEFRKQRVVINSLDQIYMVYKPVYIRNVYLGPYYS